MQAGPNNSGTITPVVFENLFLPERRDRHRRIEAAAQASDPALTVPVGQKLGGGLTLVPKDVADIVDGTRRRLRRAAPS
jgi:hypothetical protein